MRYISVIVYVLFFTYSLYLYFSILQTARPTNNIFEDDDDNTHILWDTDGTLFKNNGTKDPDVQERDCFRL